MFDHGADVAVHSATKYIGGHGTSIGGIVVDAGRFDWAANAERFPGLTKPDPSYHGVVWSDALGPAAYIGRVRTVLLRNTGAALSPFNAFLFLQGLETLPLRMERHSANALAVARHLEGALGGQVGQLPGPRELARTTSVAKRQLSGGFGGLVTFGITGGREAGQTFIESLELFSHLANIGDAKSLAIHNATTTHSQLNEEELAASGVTQDTVRLSVGIEHIEDILGRHRAGAREGAGPGHGMSVTLGDLTGERAALARSGRDTAGRALRRARPARARIRRAAGAGRGRLRDLRRARRRRARTACSSATR